MGNGVSQVSCFNLTGKPQTTAQAAEARRKATEAARVRAAKIAAGKISMLFPMK